MLHLSQYRRVVVINEIYYRAHRLCHDLSAASLCTSNGNDQDQRIIESLEQPMCV